MNRSAIGIAFVSVGVLLSGWTLDLPLNFPSLLSAGEKPATSEASQLAGTRPVGAGSSMDTAVLPGGTQRRLPAVDPQAMTGTLTATNATSGVPDERLTRREPEVASPGSWRPVVTSTQAVASAGNRPAPREERGTLIRSIQTELKRVGCFSGEVDGSWGPETRAALKSFVGKVNANLPTGEPDMILLTLLRGQRQQSVCTEECPTGMGVSMSGRCLPKAILASGAGGGAKAAKFIQPQPEGAVGGAALTASLDRVKAPVTQEARVQALAITARPNPLPGRMAVGVGADAPVQPLPAVRPAVAPVEKSVARQTVVANAAGAMTASGNPVRDTNRPEPVALTTSAQAQLRPDPVLQPSPIAPQLKRRLPPTVVTVRPAPAYAAAPRRRDGVFTRLQAFSP